MDQAKLYDLNKTLEMAMQETARDKLIATLKDDSEHGLTHGMFIKNTFEKVYEYLKENGVDFQIYKQQSAYTIAGSLIACLHKPTELRDLVRTHTGGLLNELGWEIEPPREYINEFRDTAFDDLSKLHRRMFNVISNIAKEYTPKLQNEKFVNFEGVVDRKVRNSLYNFLTALADIEDDYIKEIYQDVSGYIKHVHDKFDEYSICTYPTKRCRPLTDELLSTQAVHDISIDITTRYTFMTQDLIDDAIKQEWFTHYLVGIIESLDFLELVNGAEYDCVGTVVAPAEGVNEELIDWINERAISNPTATPLVVQPLDWIKGETEGGFHWIGAEFIPTRKKEHTLPSQRYLDSVNKIQRTGFRINRKLFALIKQFEYEAEIHERKPRGWTQERYKRDCASKRSKNRDINRIIDIASDYIDYEHLYFTMYADFRGRVYYRQEYLSPQGQDISKALLEFDEGYVIGNDKKALRWLRINLANLGGKDDVKYTERVAWVKRNENKIRQLVKDPKSQMGLFEKADKPWQFLAACIDYVDYLNDPMNHKSRLPVGMDGKCNGSQHWCAMLRDEVGGAKVALIDSDKPSDLYLEVMGSLLSLCEVITSKEPSEDDDKEYDKYIWTIRWVDSGGIKRKLVKTPTMTKTYAAGKKAYRGYVANYCIDNGIVFSDDKTEHKRHINHMVDMIIAAIDKTMSVSGGMNFVQNAVTGIDEVHYETPMGFHLYMNPKRSFKREFKVKIDKRVRHVTFSYEGNSTDHLAIHTGIAPNFVHSMDATHMLLVVAACPNITHWMMIHDQFSCHAVFVEDMQNSIRHEFVELYLVDQLERFREQMGKSEKECPLPKYGKLDLNLVKKSKYFFS